VLQFGDRGPGDEEKVKEGDGAAREVGVLLGRETELGLQRTSVAARGATSYTYIRRLSLYHIPSHGAPIAGPRCLGFRRLVSRLEQPLTDAEARDVVQLFNG
jgi:hypothetical protein